MRLCPQCGLKTDAPRCPDDGTHTLVLTDSPPDARMQPGTEINGRYRVGKMIGHGGFGAVYRGTSIATGQDIAIKVLAIPLGGDDLDMIQRFFAEAQITASLQHPNTIRVFDFGQTESGALYITMELLSGQPLVDVLSDRLKQGQVLTEQETITIGAQVLRSLAEAHLADLVHRDLKPHNIFLHQVKGDDPVVKVLDFGIAKRLGQKFTGTGKAFGTPQYMSPEHARGRAIDRRSDLYALGAVLYQCVAGRPPFDGEDPMSVLLAHVTDEPPDLRQTAKTPVSEGFVQVVEKALAKDPIDRFPSAIEMRQALEGVRGSDVTASLRLGAVPQAVDGGTLNVQKAPTDNYSVPGATAPARPMTDAEVDAPTVATDVAAVRQAERGATPARPSPTRPATAPQPTVVAQVTPGPTVSTAVAGTAGLPVVADPVPAATAPAPARSNQMVVLGVVVGALALVAIAVMMATGGGRSDPAPAPVVTSAPAPAAVPAAAAVPAPAAAAAAPAAPAPEAPPVPAAAPPPPAPVAAPAAPAAPAPAAPDPAALAPAAPAPATAAAPGKENAREAAPKAARPKPAKKAGGSEPSGGLDYIP